MRKAMKKASWLIFLLMIAALCGNQFTAYALSPNPDADPDEFAEHAEEFWASMLDDPLEDEPEDSNEESENDNDSKNSNLFADYWWLFAIGAGIIVLGGAALIIIRKKKPGIVQTAIPVTNHYPVMIGNLHHIGARESQQDSFCISDISNTALCARKGMLGVVADGMGGMADGAEVSSIVSRTMLQYFNEAAPSGHPELDLLNMLYVVNENINRFMSGREKSGSTVVAVIIYDRNLYWVAVGDSRIYLIRNGAIIQLNREHVYSVELDEKAASGEISWETASGAPNRDALTSYLGIKTLEKVDRSLRPMHLVDGDRILLMSDGVFDTLSDDEILHAMSLTLHESTMRLQEMVLTKQNPNQDNFTAIVFEYRGEVA
jgi:protein phosphatase